MKLKVRVAGAAMALGILAAASASHAATFVLSLSGDPTGGTYGSFVVGGSQYHTFSLDLGLGDATPFTINSGDEIQTTISLASLLTVPNGTDFQFLGVNFNGSTNPSGPSTTGSFTFSGLTGSVSNPTSNNCGNCLSDLFGQPGNGAFSFTGLYSDVVVQTLSAPFTINDVTLSYQVNDLAAAVVPEPATWAMMLVGVFGMGAVLRSSRRKRLSDVATA
jgi:hypothetical protein